MTQTSYLAAASVAGLAFYFPDLFVGKEESRGEAIFLGLPDALDLMVVCVEARVGLDAAMAAGSRVSWPNVARLFARNSQSPTSSFRWVAHDETCCATWASGRSRRSTLTGGVIIQAEKFGSSIAAALRAQSDAMRLRRRQLAEERAAQTSVKIMLPLILFIFPAYLS